FLYLLALSVLLHVAAYQLIIRLPAGNPPKAEQTTMVDITDLPLPPEPVKPPPAPAPAPAPRVARPSPLPETPSNVNRFAEERQRVPKETARREPLIPSPLPLLPPAGQPQAKPQPKLPAAPAPKGEALPTEKGGQPVTRGEGIFKSKSRDTATRPALFPSANTLARLEERYREKYVPEVEQGDTGFLNTDDIRFGSFYRRLENAVYGVWRYPREAAERGIEGTTPVRITFDREGKVVQVELLESSGSRILDNEVVRTLNEIGPIGSLPRGYVGDTFRVIAFFHYINGRGRLH
ncbi:TonB family protein, partial [Geomonas sp.]|uniref:energy transducer TonB n=1 Tax=Geomonas sp. TaxID=2651584 RepID=UPI002B4A951B